MHRQSRARIEASQISWLLVGLLAWMAGAASSAAAPREEDETSRRKRALLAFVSDSTGGDAQVEKAVREALERPDRSLESVGFYLSDDASDFDVAFYTALSRLEDAGYARGFEDKYVNEALHLLARDPAILSDPRAFSGEASRFADELSETFERPAREEPAAARRFAAAASQLETAAAADGVYLLSFELGGGDTHFLLPVDRATYDRWRNVAFTSDLRVAEVLWSLFWDSIAYTVFDTGGSLPYQERQWRPLPSLAQGDG